MRSADGEFLNNLYVLPEHQGRGIGTALLAVVMKHSRDGVKLKTFEPNEAAIRFYERHDFQTLRRTDGHTNEENVPDRLMAWRPMTSPALSTATQGRTTAGRGPRI